MAYGDAETFVPPAPDGLIGKPLDRVDGPLKVTGRARYAFEHGGAGQAAYGVLVTATIAKGRVAALDTAAARGAPGVLLVMDHTNAPPQAPYGPAKAADALSRPKPQFADDRVRFYGQPVAMVVAETFEQAKAAADLVRVTYAAEPGRYELKPEATSKPPTANAGLSTDSSVGDFQAKFAAAPVQLDETWTTPYHAHSPIEPHAAHAEWDGDRLTVHGSSQIVRSMRQALADTLQLDRKQVRVVSRYIGGGFGGKLATYADTVCAALAARALKRPVKVALSRQQVFHVTSHRPASIQQVRIGAERDGTFTAFGHDCWLQSAAVEEFVEQAAAATRSLYAAPHRRTSHRIAALDLPVAFAMRAPGEAIGMLAVECAVDEMAEKLSLDPIALRIKNEPTVDPEKQVPFSRRRMVDCMQEGAARFGWSRRQAAPGAVREGDWLIGLGMSAAFRPNYLRDSKASIRLNENGSATARLDMTDIGTGSYTILTQIAAERLGLDPGVVQVELGDTDFAPTPGSGGSFGAESAGGALDDACLQLRARLAAAAVADPASPLHGADAGQAQFRDSRIYLGNASQPLAEIAARLKPEEREQVGQIKPGSSYKKYSQASYGAHFAEVAVHARTGEARLRRMLGVFTAGRILNAKTARSQLLGGLIWGAGAALTEAGELDLRHGAFTNIDLAEYHVLTHADAVEVDAVLLDDHDDKANPLGMKGVGELGICGAGAAVVNAVYNASGVRVRDYPVTVEKLLPGLPKV